jgi:hypothetical protein
VAAEPAADECLNLPRTDNSERQDSNSSSAQRPIYNSNAILTTRLATGMQVGEKAPARADAAIKAREETTDTPDDGASEVAQAAPKKASNGADTDDDIKASLIQGNVLDEIVLEVAVTAARTIGLTTHDSSELKQV